MSEALWSLIGVFVGFLLSEVAHWLKQRAERRERRAALISELRSIIRMIPSKLDILAQAQKCFTNARLMLTASTHFPKQAYSRLISTAPELLKADARDCLHVLHENLRIIDESMDGLEDRFNAIAEAHSIGQAVEAATGAIRDLEQALHVCKSLAQSVLDGAPVNVYQLQDGAQQSLPADVPASAASPFQQGRG